MKQNINWTKLLIIGITFSITGLILNSCGGGGYAPGARLIKNIFFYVNSSNHHISISTYNSGIDSTYILMPSDSLLLWEDLPVGKSYNRFLIVRADSVKIDFNYGARQLKYLPDDTCKRNILHQYNYYYDYFEDYQGDFYIMSHMFLFMFNNEDFELAEPTAPNPF
jgi:hypothetical protein